ncbi:uncharacterized protein MYCFIDRAFT_199402 [Pseudocercospora fijiensis CIRAD86]|uniref:Uncharacterized protein n=1 Tax=Pseudocercospora fijiensis (strain CIRAD86) TaxID=383855 RepID=M3AQN5_PSEFD|nr:uncharacterized protein MYCFIDRAFT_199402 [Pseudocercospora fijiensis CIRAD86]EME79727.1 hypothetical protein MYCFIDRAFT_199402 [Pseudocercospora fijiensis CIRAD86]
MDSTSLEDIALSYRDISRGRLINVEGNPFAVLHLDVIRRGRRIKKRISTPFALARKQADSMSPIRQATGDSNNNPYEALYVYGETTFLALPTELRDMVYNEAIGHCQASSPNSCTDPGKHGYCCCAVICKGARRYTRVREEDMHMSMLLVNKQIGEEWREVLDKHVPVHLQIDMTLKNLDDSSKRLVGNMSKALPTETVKSARGASPPAEKHDRQSEVISTFAARGAFLEICCITEGWAPAPDHHTGITAELTPSEEEMNFHIITSAGFEGFCKRLRLCAKLEDLVVEWRLSSNEDYVMHAGSQSGTPNMLFESMIQVIEAIPRLKRYCLECGNYVMFASRPIGETWGSDKTLRLTHDIEDVLSEAPCMELYRDLKAEAGRDVAEPFEVKVLMVKGQSSA